MAKRSVFSNLNEDEGMTFMHGLFSSTSLAVGKRVVPRSVREWLNLAIRDPMNDRFDARRLRRAARRGEILRVEIGKGRAAAQPGWYRTNINTLNVWKDSDWATLFGCESRVSNLLAEHVLEHIAPKLLKRGLENCFRYLVPGGRFRISVPDGNNPDPEYVAGVEPGGSGPAADDHRSLFTIESLTAYLADAGFAVEPIEFYDAQHIYHCRDYDLSHGQISRTGKPPPARSLNVDAVKPR